MPFTLQNVGAGCYALLFRDEHIGAVFSSDDDHPEPWVAMIHEHWARARSHLPHPFQAQKHRFGSHQGLKEWLGGANRRSDSIGVG